MLSAQPILTVEQLADLIHKSPTSIYSDFRRNPQSLPPAIRLPGTRRVLFRVSDVESWLDAHIVNNGYDQRPSERLAQIDVPAPRRGRPTKTDQLARAAAAQKAGAQ